MFNSMQQRYLFGALQCLDRSWKRVALYDRGNESSSVRMGDVWLLRILFGGWLKADSETISP